MLPIPDPKVMLAWLKEAQWSEVDDFVKNRGARGHSRRTIRRLTEIVDRRRWGEEYRIRREELPENLPSHQEEIWNRSERRERRRTALEELRDLTPTEFVMRVSDALRSRGYNASIVGHERGDGVDIEIWSPTKDLWAIVQCMRHSEEVRISRRDVLAFAGMFELSGAEKGFLVTTGKLNRSAKSVASQFSWLSVVSKYDVVKLIHGKVK